MTDPLPLVTAHALARFRERLARPNAPATALAVLAADARAPTDAEWRAIIADRRARRMDRETCRVLGSIVLVVQDKGHAHIVVTCWRSSRLAGMSLAKSE